MMHSDAKNLPPRATFASRARAVLGLSLFLGAASTCFAACGGPDPSIFATAYNQSCTQDSDCAAVTAGDIDCCDLSGSCGNNAAINKADLAKYQADRRSRAPSCNNMACPAIACLPGLAVCTAGKCQKANSCGDPAMPVPCK